MAIFKPFTVLDIPQPEGIAEVIVNRLDFLPITDHETPPNVLLN